VFKAQLYARLPENVAPAKDQDPEGFRVVVQLATSRARDANPAVVDERILGL